MLVIEPLDVGFAAVPFVLVGIPTKLGTELRLPWLGTNVRIPFLARTSCRNGHTAFSLPKNLALGVSSWSARSQHVSSQNSLPSALQIKAKSMSFLLQSSHAQRGWVFTSGIR